MSKESRLLRQTGNSVGNTYFALPMRSCLREKKEMFCEWILLLCISRTTKESHTFFFFYIF